MDQEMTEHLPEGTPFTQNTANVWPLMILLSFLLGLGGGFLLWGGNPTSLATSFKKRAVSVEEIIPSPSTAPEGQIGVPEQKPSALDLAQQVNPSDGYSLGIAFGDLGLRLVSLGAIDKGKFVATYRRAGQPLTEAQLAILQESSQTPIVFDKQNAYFLLNFFWALGLANQNPILTEGPLMANGADQIGRFASVGGWTIGEKPATELYASAPIISLTPAQQTRLETVAKNVYRPCCNNPTHFPDCNHGMAMLGMLTLLASQDATEADMFTAAKYANAFWYPQQNFELALYFQAAKNTDFKDVDASKLVSANFSSSAGFQVVHQLLAANGVLEGVPSGGNGCGA